MTPATDTRTYSATPSRETEARGTERLQLLREVSARHTDYLNGVSDAHQRYLQLATHLLCGSGASLPASTAYADAERMLDTLPGSLPEHPSGHRYEPETPAHFARPAEASAPHPHTVNGSGSSYRPAEPPVNSAPVGTLASPPAASPAPPPIAPPDLPPTTPPAATPSAPSMASDRSSSGDDDAGVADALLSADLIRGLIAEKTGYPPEMIEDDMDLGGELGIDSIKQVEILSALRDRVPELPQVEPGQLARLRSIGKIVSFFDQGATGD